jgi:ribose/xylose/arabinose/galactoside ABC-type transport system permease subunit
VTAFYHSARPDAGEPMVLRAITVAVLGGVAISGGAGKVSGVVLATLLVAFLNGGLTLLEVGSRRCSTSGASAASGCSRPNRAWNAKV